MGTYIHTDIHYITLHYITFTLPYIHKLHTYITLHYSTLHYITLHYMTLHYITLHYITLHYIALHDITLHYMAILCAIKTIKYLTYMYLEVRICSGKRLAQST